MTRNLYTVSDKLSMPNCCVFYNLYLIVCTSVFIVPVLRFLSYNMFADKNCLLLALTYIIFGNKFNKC